MKKKIMKIIEMMRIATELVGMVVLIILSNIAACFCLVIRWGWSLSERWDRSIKQRAKILDVE